MKYALIAYRVALSPLLIASMVLFFLAWSLAYGLTAARDRFNRTFG